MHIVVVAPRCWPDPDSAATLTWHLAQAFHSWGVRLSCLGWKSWPGEPERTVLETTRFLRLQRPQGFFATQRAHRELAVQLRKLLPHCDAVVVLDAPAELQPALDLAGHWELPLAVWLDRVPLGRAHRGPHGGFFRKPALPPHAAVLCCGPQAERFYRRRYRDPGPVFRVAKGVPFGHREPESDPQKARRKLTRCWPHVSLAGADRFVLLGPPGAAWRHWDWVQRLAFALGRRFSARVALAVLAQAEEPAMQRWQSPGAAPIVSLLPFHDWTDLFLAADACLWLPHGTDVPYFALYAMAVRRIILAPQVPEADFLLGQDRYGLRLPWLPLEPWCDLLAEAFDSNSRILRVLDAACNRVRAQFTYEVMVRGVLQALGFPLPEHGTSLVS